MFDFGTLNENQKQAVLTTDGPLLLIAGPGTGKTYTLVKRIAYLAKEKHVPADGILAVTFTEKAARELRDRITDEFLRQEIEGNVNDMYIGTFHSLCLRIQKEYGSAPGEKPPRLMDQFEQTYRVAAKMDTIGRLPGFGTAIKAKDRWSKAQEVCRYVNQLHEELVDTEKLLNETDPALYLLGRLEKSYRYHILERQNLMDFSTLLTDTYQLLRENAAVLSDLRRKLQYILVDEYQDTNYIQEQIVFLLAGDRKNICVVGDDDQGMYRFRGATIRNILEFSSHFAPGECKEIRIETNYRSAPEIIDLYNRWMKNTDGVNLFNWNKYRFDKTIRPAPDRTQTGASVFSLWRDSSDEEAAALTQTVLHMKETGTISDYNQVVCLFRSVKSAEAQMISAAFEAAGIPVYSPRSARFFERDEIRLMIGALLFCFRRFLQNVSAGTADLPPEMTEYYSGCAKLFKPFLVQDPNLYAFLSKTGECFETAEDSDEQSLLDVFYKLLSFSPFKDYIQQKNNVYSDRPMRNLAAFSRLLTRFSALHDLHTVTKESIRDVETGFFVTYLKSLYIDGVGEYEDETETTPAGCVSFMTIHQAKGLEFPVVIVGSLSASPRANHDLVWMDLENHGYLRRLSFEPYSDIRFFDFWRLYYTAFSRAKDMLILACGGQSKYFGEYLNDLPDVSEMSDQIRVSEVKQTKRKRMYSFTSHVSVYDGCPRQYGFYKEYGFSQHKMFQTSLGSLVHACLEDINNTAIAGEAENLTEERIRDFFVRNYQTMQADSGYFLTPDQEQNALGQVLGYYRLRKDALATVWKAEEEIRLSLPDFILQGVIDLIETADGAVEIVDYKTGPKPDPVFGLERVEHYKRQLEIYAYLVEQHYKKQVRRMHLYYTSAPEDPWISFEWSRHDVDAAIAEVRETVQKIERKVFSGGVQNRFACEYCDMKYYCRKEEVT